MAGIKDEDVDWVDAIPPVIKDEDVDWVGTKVQPVQEFSFPGAVPNPSLPPQKEPDIRPYSTTATEMMPELEPRTTAFHRGAAGGVLNLTESVATLPSDIAAWFGSDKGRLISENIRKAIPNIPPETTAEGLINMVTQYGLPATTSIKIVNKVTKGSHWAIKYVSDLMGGGLADFLATPGTVGERTQSGITDIGVSGTLQSVVPIGRVLKKGAKQLFRPSQVAEEAIRAALREQAIDPDKAITEIKRTLLNSEEYLPTTGTASGDIGLVGMERGMATKAEFSREFAHRKELNMRTISDTLEEVTSRHGGNPQKAREYFENYVDAKLSGAESAVNVAEQRVKQAEVETDEFINEFTSQSGYQADASVLIDETLKSELEQLTRHKNTLFKGIDPEYGVEIPKDRLKAAFFRMNQKRSPLDSTPTKIDGGLKARIAKIFKKPKKGESEIPLTFGALQDLRPDLSEAISKARADNQGGVVIRLAEFKQAIEAETKHLAARGDAAAGRATKALEFYENTYVPRFKEGIGNKFRKAIRTDSPWPPTATGKRFLQVSSGTREAAEQLKTIVMHSSNRAGAESAIRDHIIGNVADLMQTATGKTSLQRLDKYLNLRSVRETLEQFPGIRNEITQFKANLTGQSKNVNRFTNELDLAKQQLSKTQKELKKDATRFFVDSEPDKAIGRVLESPDPYNSMQSLVMRARQDVTGQAIHGLRESLSDYIETISRGTREEGGNLEVLRSRIVKLFKNKTTRKTIGLLYSDADMAKLKKVHNWMQTADRINKQVTSGSPTAPIQQNIQRARIVLASVYGIVKGRGIFAISSWLQKTLGIDPVEKANRILADAMLNPELAVTLLQPITEKAKNKIGYKLLTHLTNNYGSSDK